MPLFKPIDTGAAFDPSVVTCDGMCERCGQPRAVTRTALVVPQAVAYGQAELQVEPKHDLGYACVECVADLVTGAKAMPEFRAEVHVLSKLQDGALRMRRANLKVST